MNQLSSNEGYYLFSCRLEPLLYEIMQDRGTLASSFLDWFEQLGEFYSKMQIPMDGPISAGTSSLHVAIKTIMFPVIKGLLPVNMQETCLQRGYKIFYGSTCPGVTNASIQTQSVQSGFRSFLFSFSLASVSVGGTVMN